MLALNDLNKPFYLADKKTIAQRFALGYNGFPL